MCIEKCGMHGLFFDEISVAICVEGYTKIEIATCHTQGWQMYNFGLTGSLVYTYICI